MLILYIKMVEIKRGQRSFQTIKINMGILAIWADDKMSYWTKSGITGQPEEGKHLNTYEIDEGHDRRRRTYEIWLESKDFELTRSGGPLAYVYFNPRQGSTVKNVILS